MGKCDGPEAIGEGVGGAEGEADDAGADDTDVALVGVDECEDDSGGKDGLGGRAEEGFPTGDEVDTVERFFAEAGCQAGEDEGEDFHWRNRRGVMDVARVVGEPLIHVGEENVDSDPEAVGKAVREKGEKCGEGEVRPAKGSEAERFQREAIARGDIEYESKTRDEREHARKIASDVVVGGASKVGRGDE